MIHKTAIISSSVILENNVEVGAYSIIDGNVKIASGTKVKNHVSICGDVEVGNNNVIYPFSSIGTAPQDDKYKGELSKVKIGSGNIIREYVTINGGSNIGNNFTNEKNITTIGNNCVLMINSHVGHNVHIKDYVTLTNNVCVAGHCLIENNVLIGGNSAIHQHLRIGEYSLISGCIGIGGNVPSYSFVQNISPGIVGGYNIIGLKRANFSMAKIQIIKEIFLIMQNKEINFENKVLQIKMINCKISNDIKNIVDHFLSFLEKEFYYPLISFK